MGIDTKYNFFSEGRLATLKDVAENLIIADVRFSAGSHFIRGLNYEIGWLAENGKVVILIQFTGRWEAKELLRTGPRKKRRQFISKSHTAVQRQVAKWIRSIGPENFTSFVGSEAHE